MAANSSQLIMIDQAAHIAAKVSCIADLDGLRTPNEGLGELFKYWLRDVDALD